MNSDIDIDTAMIDFEFSILKFFRRRDWLKKKSSVTLQVWFCVVLLFWVSFPVDGTNQLIGWTATASQPSMWGERNMLILKSTGTKNGRKRKGYKKERMKERKRRKTKRRKHILGVKYVGFLSRYTLSCYGENTQIRFMYPTTHPSNQPTPCNPTRSLARSPSKLYHTKKKNTQTNYIS